MNSVRKEFKHRLPRLAANMTLALAFGSIGAFSSVILTNVNDGVGFYSWLVLTLVGGTFLLRALGDVLEMGNKTVELFLKRIGIQQRWSRKRITKDLAFIIVTILATFAVFPFFDALGTVRTLLQSVTAIIATGIIFLFVYDIAHAFHQILQEKVSTVANRFAHKLNGGDETNERIDALCPKKTIPQKGLTVLTKAETHKHSPPSSLPLPIDREFFKSKSACKEEKTNKHVRNVLLVALRPILMPNLTSSWSPLKHA